MVSIGIHIKKHGFHVVELSFNGSRLTLENSYEKSFDDLVTEEKRNISILEHLGSLERKYKNQSFRFCFCLPQDQVSSFFVEFPFREKFKILKTLPFEIEDKSPFNPYKVFYYGKLTRTLKNKSSVICFIAPEHHVKSFLQVVKPLKTKPYLLSVEGACLSNIAEGVFEASQKPHLNKPTLFIYMDFYQSVVLVFKEGYLHTVSHLDWGFYSIVKEMEKKYKLTFEKATDQFFEKSFVLTSDKGFTSEQVSFSNLIKKHIHIFIKQLKILKLSLETDYRVQFEDIEIYGPGTAIKNLSSFLSLKMDTRVSKMKAIPDLPSFDLKEAKNQSSLVALGLAMEGLKRPPYEGVNFLHSLYKESFSFFSAQWKSALAFISIGLICFSFYSLFRYEKSLTLLEEIETVFADYGKKIALLRSSQVSPQAVKDFLKSKEDLMTIEQVIQKEKAKQNPIESIKRLTENLKTEDDWDLKITALTVKSSNISLAGEIKQPFNKNLESSLKKITTQFKVVKNKPITKVNKASKAQKKQTSPPQEEPTFVQFHYEFILREGV